MSNSSESVIGMMDSAKWWQNPQLGQFLAETRKISQDEQYRRDALAQQKEVADREMDQRDADYKLRGAGILAGQEVGTMQSLSYIDQGMMEREKELSGLDQQLSNLTGPPSPEMSKKRQTLIGQINSYKQNKSAIEAKSAEIKSWITPLLNLGVRK